MCVGGTRDDDESDAKSKATEDLRERVKEKVQNGSTHRKVREWARDVGQEGLVPTGETDCDGRQQSQWTSRAHGARGEWAE